MEYRLARPLDFDAIVRLADANHFDNLTPDQRQDGFLTVRLTGEDFARMAREVAVVVGINDGRVAGFLGAEWIDKAGMPPVIAAAARTFLDSHYRGKLGRQWRAFLEGPLCIAPQYRGKGLRRGLHKTLMNEVRGRYDVAVSFIAFDNPRSYHGATAHGGEDEIGAFEVSGKRYHLLAFAVD